VVAAAVFPGAFQGEQVPGVGNDAEEAGAALWIAADLAGRLRTEVKTALTLAHLTPGRQQGFSEALDLFLRLPQQMQGQALGGAGADSRQPLKLLDQPGQRSGEAAQGSAAIARNLGKMV